MKRLSLTVGVAVLCLPLWAQASIVARENFDGGAVNLIGSTVPALDGGGGDWFGVGSRNAWPQGFPSLGVPFSIGDDSVFGYCNGAPFAGDTEGVFGQNSDLDNHYFGMSDTREWAANQLTATWTFNISGYTNLQIQIGMGGISDPSFGGYGLDTDVRFTAQIDGGAVQTAIDVVAIDPVVGFTTRLMDGGAQSGGGRLLVASGDNLVSKLLAEDGSAASNTYLDKTPASGPGAGQLDTFVTALDGTGSTLVLTLTANMPFEAMVFDNIVITGVPEPATAMLLLLGGLPLLRRRR